MVSKSMLAPVVCRIISDFVRRYDMLSADRWMGKTMTESAALIARIDALEIAKAHQDRAIEDLNDALAGQFKEIEALKRQLARLADEVAEAGTNSGSGEADPPPPHY
ncbi:MAG TPA: SlyX family protein [Pseudolabrys sp.]|nr:SlyX family protein [Pseudolabrys sp.]